MPPVSSGPEVDDGAPIEPWAPGSVWLFDAPGGATLARVPDFSTAPPSIPRRHGVEGFHVAKPPRSMGRGDPHGPLPRIFSTAEAARRFARTGDDGGSEGEVCFSWVLGFEAPRFSGRGWPSMAFTSALVPLRHSYGGRITAVHAERLFVSTARRLTLEATDAWLDVSTRGLQPIARSAITLAKLPELFSGLEIYAAHDAELAHLVVRSPAGRGALLFSDQGNESMVSECGYIRLTVPIPVTGVSTARFRLPRPDDRKRPSRTAITLRLTRIDEARVSVSVVS